MTRPPRVLLGLLLAASCWALVGQSGGAGADVVARPGVSRGALGPGFDVAVTASGRLTVSSGRGHAPDWALTPDGVGRAASGATGRSAGATAAPSIFARGAASVWYARTGRGLEQGFRLGGRPSGSGGRVVVAMRSAGSWFPVATGPTSVSLYGPGGGAELTYSGLTVTDASGRHLPANLETSGRSIRIAFDDRGARYPVVVDPWIQVAGLAPPADSSTFGQSVAVSASGSTATAIVGDPSGGATGDGQVTAYMLSGGTWSAGTTLTPPSDSLYFGTSVAVATTSGSSASAIVGDPSGGATGDGQSTVYTLSGGTWSAGTTLAAPGTSLSFGTSVAISSSGTTAIVGDPTGGVGTGAASIYQYSGSWGPALSLTIPAGANAHAFGTSVALSSSGTTALVGDPSGGATSHGVAYSFAGTSWGTASKLVEPPNKGAYGSSVALSGDGTTAIVGDPTGGASQDGAANVETFSAGAWSSPTALTRPSGAKAFGTSVALGGTSGTVALVGDPQTGVTGATGAATVYSGSGAVWSTGSALAAPIGAVSFGTSVAASMDGSTALVGDPGGADLNPSLTGTATTFSTNGASWNLGTQVAGGATNANSFGTSLAMSSDGSTVIEGDPAVIGGAASVFTYNGSALSPGTALAPPAGAVSFGTSVALSANGRVALVGDPGSFNSSTGTGGTATVYTFNGTSWSAGTPLPPPNTDTDTATDFGTSVALSANGTTALVGDPQGGTGTGAATVFTFNGFSWSAGTQLTAPATTFDFGTAVALSADASTALVSDVPIPAALGLGTVTSYSASNGTWSTGTALAPPSHESAEFGTSLALSQTGDVAVVGDPAGGASGTGAATTYSANGPTWSGPTSLTPPATTSHFGSWVAVSASGTEALVGDPMTGLSPFGTATVFDFSGSSWSPGTPLVPPANSTFFGTSVALSGNGRTAAVGDAGGGPAGFGAVTVFSFDSTDLATDVSPSVSPTSSPPGASVTYSASVTPKSGAGTPTGTVTFTMGLTTLCTATLASGSGHCSASTAPLGTNGVVFASYSGDISYAASVGSTPLSVGYASGTAVGVQPTSTSFGSAVTYSATVTSTGHGTPTGTVTFTAGATTLCTTPTLIVGTGNCTASNAPTGNDTVTGTYSGDLVFAGSSAGTPLSVSQAASTTAVGVSPTTSVSGQSVTYSATVTSVSGTPTGTVAFTVGGTTLCSAGLSGGSASCSASNAPVGSDTVTGTYSGDPNFAPSSATAALSVSPPPAPASGYDLVGSDGGVFVFGTPGQGFFGSLPGLGVKVNNVVGIVPTSTDLGYFLVGSDGGVFAFGNAPFENSLPGIGVHVTNIVGIVPTADDLGYFVVGSDGGVFAFGNAPFENSLPGLGVHVTNIVGIVPTADDLGYWLVSATGAVYALGDAPFVGSLGGKSPTPIVGIAATHDSGGYWLVGQNGSVFPFGDAQSFGDLPALGVSVSNVTAIVPTPDGGGYWLIGTDGGIFAFGDATEIGSLPALGVKVNNIVGAVPTA